MAEFVCTWVKEDKDGTVTGISGNVEALDEGEGYPAFCSVC